MQITRVSCNARGAVAWACLTVLLLVPAPAPGASGQPPDRKQDAPQEVRAESQVTSDHTVTIKGQRVAYRATAATQPVLNPEGQAVASVFYVYYQRADVQDQALRPLVFSFNGGPGSASVWMHIGYTGPRFLEVDDEGFPIQPYGIRENAHSILDVADIVYVDPVNTGFSRVIGDADRRQFFGVNEDIEYLARWIDAFVSRHERWRSPKFLIGESYGTTRVAGLAARLQDSHWMYLNGVVLVSPTGLGISRDGPVGSALRLPYFTAAAWYHKALAPDLQKRDLEELLPEVEQFTIEQYLPALARGGFLEDARRKQIAAQMARFAGLSEQVVLNNNLAIDTQLFWRELLRHRGQTIGRLDSRYVGLGRDDAGITPDFDPALTSWNHSFAPAINHYLRDVLKYETNLQYWLFGPVQPWNRTGDNTGENLRKAMAQNPFLRVMIQAGYYDGATDYFSAKYTMWNMDPGGKLKDRLRFEAYRSGHMMYLRQEDLATSNEHLREFIREAIPRAAVDGALVSQQIRKSRD
jgi:carboxypeptidase C (cathepsin A)